MNTLHVKMTVLKINNIVACEQALLFRRAILQATRECDDILQMESLLAGEQYHFSF